MTTYRHVWYHASDIGEVVPALTHLLADAVQAGASIGFVWPVDVVEVSQYWDGVRDAVLHGHKHLLVVFDEHDTLVGTAQLEPAGKANGRHRAEVQKVIVAVDQRQRGIGRLMMHEIDARARMYQRTLLVLDTRVGDAGERLYQALGWHKVGEIPGYAISPDLQSRDSTALYYRQLD